LTPEGFVPGSFEISVVDEDGEGVTNLSNYPGAEDEHPD
jgi:hypothetical protein